MNVQKHFVLSFASLALFVVLCLTGTSTSAPPSGGSSTGGGTIYYSASSATRTMNSDGSAKTVVGPVISAAGDVSRQLHGGKRWILQTKTIAGEMYPDGNTRREIFAVRVDGAQTYSVQLTNDITLQPEFWGSLRWTPGDGAIAFAARRWFGDQVLEGGVYTAPLAFDAAGNIVGLQQQPAHPAIPLPLVLKDDLYSDAPGPDLWSFDWSPDGTRIVYRRYSQSQLRIATLSGQDTLLVMTEGGAPVWSPDNTKIAFESGGGNIDTINIDGTGRKTIIKAVLATNQNYSVYSPYWSPTGSHLMHLRVSLTSQGQRYDIYRATSTGGSQTNLTSGGNNGNPTPIGWR